MNKINRVITKIIAVLVLFMGVLNVIDAIYAANSADAVNGTACPEDNPCKGMDLTAEVNLESAYTLNISSSNINLNVTPSKNGTFGSTYREGNSNPITVKVFTNEPSTMNVLMTASTTSLVATDSNGQKKSEIESIGGTYTVANFPNDRWGYSIDGINYNKIGSSTIVDSFTRSGSNEHVTNVYFGMKLTQATPPGEYTTTLVFSAAKAS